jgi:hypothetical protein
MFGDLTTPPGGIKGSPRFFEPQFHLQTLEFYSPTKKVSSKTTLYYS